MTQHASPSAYEPQLKGYDEFLQFTLKEWNIPGMAVAIVKDNVIVYAQGFGQRDIAQQLEVTPHTLFPIASCTKAFTATALGILVDEGKLDWDTPIKHYLPTLKLYDAFATERVTIRDLLAHRSGLPRHDLLGYSSLLTRSELVKRLQYLEPNKDLRSEWQYNNLMYALAGYLLEVISGTSWEGFIQQHLHLPLGMMSSTTSTRLAQSTADFALPYREENGKIHMIPFHESDLMAPAGALNSNALEMCSWLLLQLQKGKYQQEQLISQPQLAQIHRPHIPLDERSNFIGLAFHGYALGWQVGSYRGHRMVLHAGGVDGFSSLVTFLPDDQIGVVVLTNKSVCIAPAPITFTTCDRLLGLVEISWNEQIKQAHRQAAEAAMAEAMNSGPGLARVPGTRPSHPLVDYVGAFEHPGYGTGSIALQGEQLTFSYNAKIYSLTHMHYDTFELILDMGFPLPTYLSFTTNVKGEIGSLAARLEPEVKEIVFTRVPPRE